MGEVLSSVWSASAQQAEPQPTQPVPPPANPTILPEVVVEARKTKTSPKSKPKASAPKGTATPTAVPALSPVSAETAWGPVDGYAAKRSATGTKTDAAIMDIPASVQVVPREVIDDQAALNLKDVYSNLGGVQQAGNTLNAQSEVLPIIRGFESPVLLRNGLRSTQIGTVDLVNIERVEVLKGPASILFGALEPGGVINFVTKRPQQVPSYEVKQEIGSYQFARTTTDLTGPASSDGSLSYRLNAAYTNSDSFRDFMELERTAVAPSLLWRPSGRTEVLFDFAWTHERQPYDTGIPITAFGKPLVSQKTFVGDPDLAGRHLSDHLASYQLTHKVGSVWTIRNQLQFHRASSKNEAIRATGVGRVGDVDFIGLRYQNEDQRLDEYQAVLDATAKFATGAVGHTLLFGTDVLYQDENAKRFRQNVPPVAITGDLKVDFDRPANLQLEPFIATNALQTGFYAQDQISLLAGGRLKLLLGARYDIFLQEGELNGAPAPDIRKDALTGRAGLLYRLADQYSVYASVSQSFNPHRAEVIDENGIPLDPEEGLQYETGIKASFFNDRLLATASIYQITKENVEVLDDELLAETGQIAFFPGVKQRSRGFELNLAGALTDQTKVIANYAYTDTEVLENLGDPDAVGEPLGGVSPHAARVWLTYSFDEASLLSGVGLGGGIRYVGRSTAQFDTDVKLDPYVVVDAAVWYDWENLRFGLNVQNLFNEEYIVRASNQAIAHPGEPLTIIGSITSRF
jgi:iron complex outermembrane recepter protein